MVSTGFKAFFEVSVYRPVPSPAMTRRLAMPCHRLKDEEMPSKNKGIRNLAPGHGTIWSLVLGPVFRELHFSILLAGSFVVP